MAKYSSEQDFINEVLAAFAARLIEQRRRNVQKEKAVASRELLQSLDYEVRKATTEQVALAMIAFETHGRFLDMKRINRRREQIPIDELKDWIKEIGLDKFKRRPTGGQARRPVSGDRLLNELAWGISRKIKSRGSYKKRRRRLQTGFESLLGAMIDELRKGYLDRTVEQIKESLKV